MAAKRAAFDALPPEEQAAALEARRAAREARAERRRQRKASARELARRIIELSLEGRTSEEIAREVGRPARTVRWFAAQHRILISRSSRLVRCGVAATRPRREALERLAADYRTTPLRALEDLMIFMLEDDATTARRTLHVTRRARA